MKLFSLTAFLFIMTHYSFAGGNQNSNINAGSAAMSNSTVAIPESPGTNQAGWASSPNLIQLNNQEKYLGTHIFSNSFQLNLKTKWCNSGIDISKSGNSN